MIINLARWGRPVDHGPPGGPRWGTRKKRSWFRRGAVAARPGVHRDWTGTVAGGQPRVQRIAAPPLPGRHGRGGRSCPPGVRPRGRRRAPRSVGRAPTRGQASSDSSSSRRKRRSTNSAPVVQLRRPHLESPIISPRLRTVAARCFHQWAALIATRQRANGWPDDSLSTAASAGLALIEGALLLTRVSGQLSHLAHAKHAALTLLTAPPTPGRQLNPSAPQHPFTTRPHIG